MSCTVIGRVFSAWARQTWMWAGSQDLLPGARLELEKMWKVSRLATSLVFARIHRSLHHNMHIMIHRGFQQSANLDHTHRCWRLLEYSFLINEHDHASQMSFFSNGIAWGLAMMPTQSNAAAPQMWGPLRDPRDSFTNGVPQLFRNTWGFPQADSQCLFKVLDEIWWNWMKSCEILQPVLLASRIWVWDCSSWTVFQLGPQLGWPHSWPQVVHIATFSCLRMWKPGRC